MAYNKHTWVAPEGTNLNRFSKANETSTSVDLIQNPSLTNVPTPFSAEWMNEMEEGIYQAHSSQYYPGYLYEQMPGGYTPNELKAKGVFPADSQWSVWNHRAEVYELVPAAQYPSAIAEYAQGQNVAANAYRIYQLSGDDRQIWKAKAAISSTPARIDPLYWELLPYITRVRRCDLHDVWTDNDLGIGDTVTYDGNTYKVSGILVLGGKYLAGAGGNRGTFNAGTQGDSIRNITGHFSILGQSDDENGFLRIDNNPNSAFYVEHSNYITASAMLIAILRRWNVGIFNPSRVVPTGNDNAPRTLSVRYWRRVS